MAAIRSATRDEVARHHKAPSASLQVLATNTRGRHQQQESNSLNDRERIRRSHHTFEANSDNKRNTLWLLRVRELSETDQQNMDTRSSNQ